MHHDGIQRQGCGLASGAMAGWNSTLDYDPQTDGDEEAWARAVALEGWRTWHASGVWVAVGNRRVRVGRCVGLACVRWSAHHHARTCSGSFG